MRLQGTTRTEVRIVEKDGSNIAELPRAFVDSVTWELNGVGAADVSFDPMSPGATDVLLAEREVQIWLDDELEFWGVGRTLRGNSRRLTLGLEGLFGYLHYRYVLQENLVYENVEQMNIAAALMSYAQSDVKQGVNANLHIGHGVYSPSGIARSRTYVSERKHNLFEAISEFPTLDEGFDMEIEITPDGSKFWTPYYPQKGAYKPLLGLEYGRSIIDYTYDEDAIKLATKIAATGGVHESETPGAPREKNEYTYEDVAASERLGVHVVVLPSGARSDLPWLEARAKRGVALRKQPLVIPEVVCRQGGKYPRLVHELKTGDTVPVKIDHGRIQVATNNRIQSKTWDGATDRVKFTFALPVEVTAA